MPRLFMALHLEERDPIVEIMERTPAIPESCQWALFLRNHDELTLEMVTDDERDYMYLAYSADPMARLNVGIRRRLAPLMGNSRQRIELLTSVLFSLPGTPIIYYGDEIGMGDSMHLGDRNGVRTPMQWSGDRNAGFSRADPQQLFSPVISDPVYGYQAVNVESEEHDPASLLHWTRNMIRLRRLFRVFGRGAIEFLQPANRAVLAYIRSHEKDDAVLCVANLARKVQPVHLDLSAFAGFVPVEILGYTEFPVIGAEPYFLTLGPYAFYWFELQPRQR
jgi:maltose alpha-D-glucosyltransferase/alpha-amylase